MNPTNSYPAWKEKILFSLFYSVGFNFLFSLSNNSNTRTPANQPNSKQNICIGSDDSHESFASKITIFLHTSALWSKNTKIVWEMLYLQYFLFYLHQEVLDSSLENLILPSGQLTLCLILLWQKCFQYCWSLTSQKHVEELFWQRGQPDSQV